MWGCDGGEYDIELLLRVLGIDELTSALVLVKIVGTDEGSGMGALDSPGDTASLPHCQGGMGALAPDPKVALDPMRNLEA